MKPNKKKRNKKNTTEDAASKKQTKKLSELKTALDYAEAIVATVREPLVVLYPGLKVKTANNSFYKTFKVSKKETEGKQIYDLGNGQWNIPSLKKLLEEILPQKKILKDFEVEHSFKDIGHKIMLLNARKLDVRNDPMIFLAIEDITEKKSIESAVEKERKIVEFERQKMFNLFMNAPALICVLRGPKHIYELANKPYMQMVGSKRNLIGNPIRKAIPELKEQGIFEILDKVYKTGNPYIGKEMPIKINITETGKTEDTVLNIVLQPYSDSNGKVQGIISYASDITSLVNKTKRIEELSRQKDEFIGVASHELKTPVTSLKGYTQILQMRFEQEGNKKAVELLSKMDRQINKLTNLISDLLDATKIEGGILQFHEVLFDFNELVTEIIEEMQQATQQHTIIAKLALSSKIYGDRDRIGQVITNFISNAIKYSPFANKIILTTSKEGNKIRLCVQDFGIGIPEEKQDKVFDRFYRVSGDKEDTYPGLGLGLFISSEFVKRHKGTITVTSTKGEGSTFCFVLPVKKHV